MNRTASQDKNRWIFPWLTRTSTSTSTLTVMFTLGENEKGMNNSSSAWVLYGVGIRIHHTLKHVNMYNSNTQIKILPNLVASCKTLPECVIFSDTTHSPTSTISGLLWQSRRGRQFLAPLQQRFLQALKAPLNQATANIKQHRRVPCSVYIRQRQSAFHFSPAECQTGYQTPKANTRQQEQAGIICMESCYRQSRHWSVEGTTCENQSKKTTAFQTESKQMLGKYDVV